MIPTPKILNPSAVVNALRGVGLAAISTLKDAMKLGTLVQSKQVTRVGDAVITSSSCFGYDTAYIDLPSEVHVFKQHTEFRYKQKLLMFGVSGGADLYVHKGASRLIGIVNVADFPPGILAMDFPGYKNSGNRLSIATIDYDKIMIESADLEEVNATFMEQFSPATLPNAQYYKITGLEGGYYFLTITQKGATKEYGDYTEVFEDADTDDARYVGRVYAVYTEVSFDLVSNELSYGEAFDVIKLNSISGTWEIHPEPGAILNVLKDDLLWSITAVFTPDDTSKPEASFERLLRIWPNMPTLDVAGLVFTYGEKIELTSQYRVCENSVNPVLDPLDFGILVLYVNGVELSDTTILDAGTHVLVVEFWPTSGTPYFAPQYESVSDTTSITINKSSLAVTAADMTKTYNAAMPALNYNISGYVNGETFETSGIGGLPSLTTTATYNSPVGDYPISCYQGTLTSTNYNFTFVWATFSIVAAGVVFTVTNTLQTYDGTSRAVTVTTSPSNVAKTVKYNGSTTVPVNAGTYTVVVECTDSNYEGATTAVLVVNKKVVALTLSTLNVPYTGNVIQVQNTSQYIVQVSVNYGPYSANINPGGYFTVGPNAGSYLLFWNIVENNFKNSPQSSTVNITRTTLAITVLTVPITYGQTLAQAFTMMAVNPAVSGNWKTTTPLDAVLPAGSYSVTVTFFPELVQYIAAETTVTITVNKATPVIVWPEQAPITYGTPLSATQLCATTDIDGTFEYDPALGEILPVDSGTWLYATFTPTDTANYTSVDIETGIVITKATLTVSPVSESRLYGLNNPPFNFNMTGFVNNEDYISSGIYPGVPTITCAATSSSLPGTYAIVITVGSLVSDKYNFVFGNAVLTILKLDQPNIQIYVSHGVLNVGASGTAFITGGAGSTPVSYYTNHPAIVIIQQNGVYTGGSAGVGTIWAQKKGDAIYKDSNQSFAQITVQQAAVGFVISNFGNWINAQLNFVGGSGRYTVQSNPDPNTGLSGIHIRINADWTTSVYAYLDTFDQYNGCIGDSAYIKITDYYDASKTATKYLKDWLPLITNISPRLAVCNPCDPRGTWQQLRITNDGVIYYKNKVVLAGSVTSGSSAVYVIRYNVFTGAEMYTVSSAVGTFTFNESSMSLVIDNPLLYTNIYTKVSSDCRHFTTGEGATFDKV